MIRASTLAVLLALPACAGGADKANQSDANTSSDASGCHSTLSFNPAMPTADPVATIRVVANVPGGGVPSYSWRILFQNATDVGYTFAAADQSQIDFIAPQAGPYYVSVTVSGVPCDGDTKIIDVQQAGAHITDFRLRVTPGIAPPQDTIIQVIGGADFTRDVVLDPGLPVSGTVRSGGSGVPAYLRFMPVASPTAIVEAFTQSNGAFSVQLLGQSHDVLVVPTVAGLAPRKLTWTIGTTTLAIDAGTAVSGVVRDAASAALAGAKVQIVVGGVPSTLATTAADGSFTVRVAQLGATSDVDITPPPGRGLARLHASGAFDLTQSVQVQFTGATCDLANTTVKRAATSLPGANVVVVGTMASAGTVVAGITATATGVVRIPSTVNGTGKLPSVLVPRAPLAAVVAITSSDLAVASIDTTTCPALAIDAPALVTATGVVQATSLATLPGVELEATPIGDLALADALAVQTRTAIGGGFTLALASGGHYDLRAVDPSGRGAPFVSLGVLPTTVPSSITLPVALHGSGDVSVANNPNPVRGASVQILCLACTGIAAARSIAETATDSASHYRIAIPDPGTM